LHQNHDFAVPFLGRQPRSAQSNSALVGESSAIVRLREAIDQVAAVDIDILIEGEAGVGKELVALMLHRASVRRAQPFVGVACGALILESTAHRLFGDAGLAAGSMPHIGQVESAHRGTLFLDGIDELTLVIQQRVLDVIETQSVQSSYRIAARKELFWRRSVTLFKTLFDKPHRIAGQPHFPTNYDGRGCWWCSAKIFHEPQQHQGGVTEKLTLAFHGAARIVTGSCMEFCHRGKRGLADCGLIQGSGTEEPGQL